LNVWNWIKNENNREALKFIGIAIVAIPTAIFGFINWLGGDLKGTADSSPSMNVQSIEAAPESLAIKVGNQLRQCLNGNVIECQGLKYKKDEAHLRCVNDIRESDPVKKSFAHNNCAAMTGTAFQIMALAKQVGSHCNNFTSPACVKARQDASYLDSDQLSKLASYLSKYN